MSKNIVYTAIFSVGTVAGMSISATHHLVAAATADPPPPVVTKYEKLDQAGGCGAPERNLMDNDQVRVDLISFPEGFNRCGMLKRRYSQLLVYLDKGDFVMTLVGKTGLPPRPRTPADGPRPTPPPGVCGPPPCAAGTVVWEPKDSVVNQIHINHAYRVLFVQFKH